MPSVRPSKLFQPHNLGLAPLPIFSNKDQVPLGRITRTCSTSQEQQEQPTKTEKVHSLVWLDSKERG
jgi:hypothetical protein